jgi:hypothetical protein
VKNAQAVVAVVAAGSMIVEAGRAAVVGIVAGTKAA